MTALTNLTSEKRYLKYFLFSPEDAVLKLNPRYAAVDQLIGLLNSDEGSGDEDGAVGVEQDGGPDGDGEEEDDDEEDEEEDDGEEEDHDEEEDEDDLETKGLARKERNVQDGLYTEEDDEDEEEEQEEEDEN